jgi:hypothetical protein
MKINNLVTSVHGNLAYKLPTIKIANAIDRCIFNTIGVSSLHWQVNIQMANLVRHQTHAVHDCVFNAVNNLSIKLIKDE